MTNHSAIEAAAEALRSEWPQHPEGTLQLGPDWSGWMATIAIEAAAPHLNEFLNDHIKWQQDRAERAEEELHEELHRQSLLLERVEQAEAINRLERALADRLAHALSVALSVADHLYDPYEVAEIRAALVAHEEARHV